jgi:aspartyl-tRNA(Asn)/glutamyl-tRNA(Gln) amidotransferase subunit C
MGGARTSGMGGRVIIFAMSLTLEEVEHIAELARLRLTDEEKARYREQLSAILDYFAQLQELDTADIPPTSSVLPPRSVLREDQSRPGLDLNELLHNAPEADNRQFRIPPVLE